MRRMLLFGSRFALGIVLALTIGLAVLLISTAPLRVESGIAWVYLRQFDQGYVRFSGHELVCNRQPNQDQCTIEIADRPLMMSVIYKNGAKREMWDYENVRCEATYADQPVSCQVTYDYATHQLPILDITDDFGLSKTQFQALQSKEPLAKLYDADLFRLVMLLSIGSGIFTTTTVGLQPGQTSHKLASVGAGLSTAIAIIALAPFLVLRWTAFLGLPLILCVAIGVACFTAITAPHYRQFSKLITSLSSGLIVFSILWVSFLVALLTLGFAD